MTQRIDTMARYALIALAIFAVAAMFSVAANENLDRTGRFALLILLGVLATGSWVTVELGNSYVERAPLITRWGRPPRPSGAAVAAPRALAVVPTPATFELRVGATAGALAASTVAAIVTGVIGYALAGSARSDGGLVFYIACAGMCLVAARSLIRLVGARRALRIDAERLILGSALGYVPPLLIARSDVSGLEIASDPPAKIAVIDDAGRRFEIRPDHLRPAGLAGHLAAIWPEAQWRQLPASEARL